MSNVIQVKRGAQASLPALSAGEFGFSTNTFQLNIGSSGGNKEALMHHLFDANTFLYAVTDDTPVVKTRAEVMGLLSGQSAADFAMNTHKITGVVDPTAAQDVATKAYADSIATGLDIHGSCDLATAAALPSCTSAGSGVGKTLTGNAVGVLTIDGVVTVLNDRILVKDQDAPAGDNGIYKVTTEGTSGVAFVLTRATDFDENADVTAGAFCFIEEGTVAADHGFVLTTNDPITVDTTALGFSIFSSAGEGISEALFDANTILKADADNTPLALTVAASRIVGRTAGGSIDALAKADVLTIINVEDGADETDSTNVSAAGAVMESDFNANTFLYAVTDNTPVVKSRAEVLALLSGQASAEFLLNTQKIGGVVDPTTAQQVATKNYCDTRAIDGGSF